MKDLYKAIDNLKTIVKEESQIATWPKSDDDESAPDIGDTVMHDKHGLVKVLKITDRDMMMEPAEYIIQTKSGNKKVSYDQLVMGESVSIEERVTYKTLAKLSGIKDPNKIFPGQKVKLPGGKSYTVKKGDTLSGIAEKYRLSQVAKNIRPRDDNPMAPPEKKISQKMSPGNPFGPDKRIKPQQDKKINPTMPNLNRYAQKDGEYKLITPPKQPDKTLPKPNDSIVNRITGGFKSIGRDISNMMGGDEKTQSIADRRRETKLRDKGINPFKRNTKIASKKMPDMSSKQPTKTMLEQITGKKTCL